MSTTLPSDQLNPASAQRIPASGVVIDLDVVAAPDDDHELPAAPEPVWANEEQRPQRRWWGRAQYLRQALRQCSGTIADLTRLALLPTALGYGVVHFGRQAAGLMSTDRAANVPHSIPVAAHDFVFAGRELLARIVDSGLPMTVLVVMIVFGAMRGLLFSHSPVTAGIWWSARLVMPPFFFLVTVSMGAHLAVPHWLLATPFLAYVAFVAVNLAPVIRRATRRRHHASEAEQS